MEDERSATGAAKGPQDLGVEEAQRAELGDLGEQVVTDIEAPDELPVGVFDAHSRGRQPAQHLCVGGDGVAQLLDRVTSSPIPRRRVDREGSRGAHVRGCVLREGARLAAGVGEVARQRATRGEGRQRIHTEVGLHAAGLEAALGAERCERGGQREGVRAGAEGDGDGLEIDAVEELVEVVEPLQLDPSGSVRPVDQAAAAAPGEVLEEVLVGHLRGGVVDPLGDRPPAAPG